MSDFLTQISPSDRRAQGQMDELLQQEGIQRDGNLDYSCGLFDENYRLVATGSCYKNTIRCLAVSQTRQGEGLLNQVVSHLMEVQAARGNLHLFLYTKCQSAKFFADLGFSEIARVDGTLVFMENRRRGFVDYCEGLKKTKRQGEKVAAIVMNANPFTLGHQYLVERAAQENDAVHLFILSEEAGPIPFSVRRRLVEEGVAHLPNVVCHDSGSYLISAATFPSYFLKDSDTVIRAHAALDLAVFRQIAPNLNISRRYVGEEPTSHVTALYNEVMAQRLPQCGIECKIVPRRRGNGQFISASTVRKLIHDGQIEEIRPLVPDTTWDFFHSPQAQGVITAIQNTEDVVHY